MKHLILPTLLSIGVALAAQTSTTTFAKFNFSKLNNGNYGESSVTALGENAFRAVLKNTAKNNHVIAMANFKYNAAAQQKLVFRVKGKKTNRGAFCSVGLLYERQGKWISAESPRFPTNYSESKKYVFSLDQDFKLGDGIYSLRQIKFVLNGDSNSKNSVSEIEVTGVRIVNSDEVSSAGSGLLVVPFVKARPAEQKGVKIFFDFDNDDLNPVRMSRVSPGKVTDPLPDAGFRHLLLEHTEGLFRMVPSPEEADVIVYSRASKGGHAGKIAQAVAAGRRLIVYGIPADPDVRALLPGTIEPLKQQGFPERKMLKAVQPDHPFLSRLKRTDASFGVYARVNCPKENVILAFEGGNPYLTSKGTVLHFNGGIGSLLDLTKTNFYDRAFLCAAGLHSGKTLDALDSRDRAVTAAVRQSDDRILESAGVSASERKNWQVGRSKDNVGRFGWLVGEPLSCNTVSRDLTVSNDVQSYRFDRAGMVTSPLRNWTRKALNGPIVFKTTEPANDVNPCALWDGIGMVEYTCEKSMDPAWKGKKISFLVKNGIDDCDEIYFNGTLIGKTDKKTPYYWMVERNYVIPEHLIHWDKPNRIVMRVENLNGSSACGSRPELWIDSGAKRPELSVSRINWSGKEFQIQDASGKRSMALSLLTPFIAYRFSSNQVFFGMENIADRAVFQTASGLRTIELKGGTFYDRKIQGPWTAPWLLLYREKNTRPLLLVFSAQPERLIARVSDGIVEGFSIQETGPLSISAGWPWGVRVFRDGLPPDMKTQIDRSLSFALNYPVACDEVFRIDRKNKLVHIIQSFRYERIKDEWNTPVRRFVFLPPLTGYMSTKKNYVRTSESLTDFGIDTKLGPTLGKMDASTVSFTLPLPDPEQDLLPAGVRNPELNAALNRSFAGGVRWSCGGRVPVSRWTPEHPHGKTIPLKNIDLFAWNFGITTALQGAQFLSPENRRKLEERVRLRFMEPLDLYQYKSAFIHRREPFSGLRYPVVFDSFYPIGTEYAPGMGSQVVYGDSNEACTVTVWIARQLADVYGQNGLARGSWNFLRYVMRHQEMIDDYAFSSGSCRETGVGAWIDMLNGEYSGMLDYANLARLAGDKRMEDQALYRAAVKGIPTLARLIFRDYYGVISPEDKDRNDYQITGFGEDGPKLMRFPTNSGNFFAANDLFDFSQGLPGTLVHLYRRYGLSEIREHLRTRSLPQLKTRKAIPSDYLQALALFSENPDWVSAALSSAATYDRTGDWPGIRVPFQLGMVLWRANGGVGLEICRNADVKKLWYDPDTNMLDTDFVAGTDAKLLLTSDRTPKRVILNGKEQKIRRSGKGILLPFIVGKNQLQVYY